MKIRVAVVCLAVLSACSGSRDTASRTESPTPGPGTATVATTPSGSGGNKPTTSSTESGKGQSSQSTSGVSTGGVSGAPATTAAKLPCAQQHSGGGSTDQAREFRSSGNAWLEQDGKRITFEFPTQFRSSYIKPRYRVSGSNEDGRGFHFAFEVTPDGRLTWISVTRPLVDKGFVSLNFPFQRALPWLEGQQQLRVDTCGNGDYRLVLSRPKPGTWVFDIRRLRAVNDEYDITQGRFTVTSGVQALPDRWRSITLDVDFRSPKYRFALHGQLDAN